VDDGFRPVRWIHQAQTCHLCWNGIPRGKPGTTTGSRGTKAFFLPDAILRDALTKQPILGPGLWECLECRRNA
jgi:hypothetical protein